MSVRTVVRFDIIDIRRYFGIAERSFGKLFDIGIHTDPMAVGVNPKNIFFFFYPDVADWPIKNCTKKDPAEFFSIFFIRHYFLKKKIVDQTQILYSAICPISLNGNFLQIS